VGGSEGSRVLQTLAFLNLTLGLFRVLLIALTSPRGASEHGSASDSESDDEALFTSVPLIRSLVLSDLDLDLVKRGSSGSEFDLCALCISAMLGSANGTSVIDSKDLSSEEASTSFRCKRLGNHGLHSIEDWSGTNRARIDRVADHSQRRY
jgi:hypothetical protein